MPQIVGPDWIDISTQATVTKNASGTLPIPSAPQMFLYGGDLYYLANQADSGPPDFTSNTMAMYQSTDYGNTWTNLDAANNPSVNASSAAFQSGLGVLTVAMQDSSTYDLFLQNFNLATGTWGARYAVASFPGVQAGVIVYAWRFANGHIGVIYFDNTVAANLWGAIWNGTSWGAPVALDGITGSGNAYPVWCNYDSQVDVVQMLLVSSVSDEMFYQQFLPAGSVSSATDTGINIAGVFENAVQVSRTIYCGVKQVLGTVAFLGYGVLKADLTKNPPVWSGAALPAVYQQNASQTINTAPSIATDGAIYLVLLLPYTDTVTFNYFFRVAVSTDFGKTWSTPTNWTTNPFFYNYGATGVGPSSPLPPDSDVSFGYNLLKAEPVVNPFTRILSVFGLGNFASTAAGSDIALLMNRIDLPLNGPTSIALFGWKVYPKGQKCEPETTAEQKPQSPRVK